MPLACAEPRSPRSSPPKPCLIRASSPQLPLRGWCGSLPRATGAKMHFTGITVLKLADGKIVEEIGLDDGVTALIQLGIIAHPLMPS